MGNFLSSLVSRLFVDLPDARVCMVGLDNAGKTTVLYKLKFGEVVTTIPTIGFNVDNVSVKNLSMTIWDVGGQQKIRCGQCSDPLLGNDKHELLLPLYS